MAYAPAAPPPYWTAPPHTSPPPPHLAENEDLVLLERLSLLEALLDRQSAATATPLPAATGPHVPHTYHVSSNLAAGLR
eukprot:scaffold6478_cov124-Isochrysis_galbana.AAC.2